MTLTQREPRHWHTCPVATRPRFLEVSNATTAGLRSGNLLAGTSFTGTTPAARSSSGGRPAGHRQPNRRPEWRHSRGLLGSLAMGHRVQRNPRRHVRAARRRTGTDTAQGTRLNFNTTATGTITPSPKMTIDPTATSASARRILSGHWKLSGTVRPISSARRTTTATGARSSSSAPAERHRRQARFRQGTLLATSARPAMRRRLGETAPARSRW